MSARSGAGGHKEEIVKEEPSRGGVDNRRRKPYDLQNAGIAVNMLVLAAVIVGLTQAMTIVMALFVSRWWLRRQVRKLSEAATGEAKRLLSQEPCQSASVINEVARLIGSEAGRSAKAALMADLAHGSRRANTQAAQAAIDEVSESSPMLGGALSTLGAGKASKLMRNPLVQLAIQGLLGNSSAGGSQSGSNGGSKPPKSFSL